LTTGITNLELGKTVDEKIGFERRETD